MGTIYPIDYTGVNLGNLIANEYITLTPGAVRVFSPLYAPFFSKNITIKDVTSGLFLVPSQYEFYYLVAAPSAIAGVGNTVYAIVIITDDTVGAELAVSYQTVGGGYTTGYETIMQMVNNILATTQLNEANPVTWNNVRNLPTDFPESLHIHSLDQTVGWEFMASQLEQIKLAILLGDQVNKDFVMQYINQAITNANAMQLNLAGAGTPFGNHVSSTTNPHNVTKAQLGLGNVQNYATATLPQAYQGQPDLYITADQALALVQNQVDLGIDAHILNYSNPHEVTATQIGLGLVANYGLATASDLTIAVNGDPKYVTNTVLSAWLANYFATTSNETNAQLATLTTNTATVLTTAQAALATGNATNVAVTAAEAQVTSTTTLVNQALTTATQNSVNANNSVIAATSLVQLYAVNASASAYSTGYAAGYADGLAAG